jgi:hypothetical protein
MPEVQARRAERMCGLAQQVSSVQGSSARSVSK